MDSCIYQGQVIHSRTAPAKHDFTYDVYMMYLDLAELDQVFQDRWFWSTTRPAPARFNRKNYLGDPKDTLDTSVRELVGERTGTRPEGPIRLLTNLSYFGYCINPISMYYCFDPDGKQVETIVADVTNTPWGEHHCYVLTRNERHADEKIKRFTTPKALHVSPFMEMKLNYNWFLTEPQDTLSLRITNTTGKERFFSATLNLSRKEITGSSLARVLLSYPPMTLKVAAAIYWQALKLWVKGIPFVTHPKKQITTRTS